MPIQTFTPDPAYLRENLHYNPDTGILVWIKPSQGRKVGSNAGTFSKDGYCHISIGDIRYLAHRIAYAIHHGVSPDGYIDHINGNPSDNRIENLRLTSPRENQQNRRSHRGGKLVGATFQKQTGRWVSRISVEGRDIHLGTFSTEQEAHDAYTKAVKVVASIQPQTTEDVPGHQFQQERRDD